MNYSFPDGIGPKKCFLMYHEELESLVMHLRGLKRARFWMTFGEQYLTHLRVLENVGMTRIDPVEFGGQQIVPIQFLKKVSARAFFPWSADQRQDLYRLCAKRY